VFVGIILLVLAAVLLAVWIVSCVRSIIKKLKTPRKNKEENVDA